MSLWDFFLNGVKGVGRDIEGAFGSTVTPAVTNFQSAVAGGALNPPALQPSPQNLQTEAQAATAALPTQLQGNSSDLLLRAATPVAAALRPVTRAVTAAELLDDPTSQLYSAGQGLNFNDFKKAYDQSAKVSPFQALTKTTAFQDSPLGYLTDKTLAATGHIDVQNVNLWNQQDIKKNYVDNPVGKWFTGIGDFVEGNIVTGGAAGAVAKSASYAARAANLTNNINSVQDLQDLNDLADSHIAAMQDENAGTKTNFGATVEKLSNSTDLGEIQSTISKFSNNDALPKLIASTNNPSVVKDLILADKGFQPSFQRLMDTGNADYLWQLGDTNSFIKGHVATTGDVPTMSPQAQANANKAYDASIQRVPAHQEIYDAFMDGKGNQVVQGTKYKPMDPPLLGNVMGAVRTRAAEINSALGVNDFDNLGGVAETVLGNGATAPVTKLIHWLGSSKPRGYVTYQGLRPWDGIQELNAVFDDTKLLRDGTNDVTTGYEVGPDNKAVPITVKASDYRKQAINDFINASGPVEKDAVIQRINTDLAKHLFYSNGIVNDTKIQDFVSQAQNRLSGLHSSLAKTGFATDVDGSRLAVDPLTQRQLADSRSMMPFGQVEREIKALTHGQVVGNAMLLPHAVVNSVFEGLQKGFSTATLGRLAYIPKNGYLEPLTTAFLSQGLTYLEDGISGFAANVFKNTKNRVVQSAITAASIPAKMTANKIVDSQMDNLGAAIKIRDDHQAAYEEMFNTNNLSPATKLEHAETIKSNLRTADNLVRRIEADISVSAKQYGVSEKIPSIYNLKQRIEFLKDQPLGQIKFASEIKTAESAVAKAIENINTLSPEIHVRDAAIAKGWKAIDNAVKEKGLAEAEQAAIIDRSAKYAKRFYGGDKSSIINVNGKQMTLDSIMDPNQFGDAIKNEFSNAAAIETTFLNETRIGAKQGLFAHKSPTGITDVDSKHYYEELAYVVNRQMRGDPLIDQALKGNDTKSIVEWAKSAEGQRYMRQFGYSTQSDLRSALQDRLNFVNRYLPDAGVQRLASERPVTDNDLRGLFADKQHLLSPIHPTDVNYGDAATMGKFSLLGASALKASNAAFGFLMRAENPLRWLWSNREFAANVEYKVNMLAKQGVDITTEQVNAVRQAAARETLTEHEKTFYTVRRQNKAIYASRSMLAFPAAGFSAMQRFGHLAVKNPARFVNYLRNYYNTYATFGVDKDGNPTTPDKAAYILVPGTKEMGLFGDKGVRLSAKTMGWMVSAPGPSWLTTFAVNRILNNKPDNEQVLKTVWDNSVGHIPGMKYDDMFPATGANTSATSAFIPSFVSDFMKYLNGNDSNTDFLLTHKMVNNYQMTMWEMGLGKKPTEASIMNMAKEYYLQKALWAFGSPFGASPQQDRPGQMFQDLGTALLKKYNGNFDQAQTEMQAILGPSFPADRYLYRGSAKAAYIAPNLETYNRVFKQFPDLVKGLVSLDPVTVGLLSADTSGDPQNVQVQSFLQNPNLKFPGTNTPINNNAMTTQEYEQAIQVNRTWNAYRTQKAQLLAAVNKLGYKRLADSPQASALWNAQVAKLGQADPQWATEYAANAAGDKSYVYAQGLSDIVNNKAFMAKNGSSDFWKQAATFINYRNQVVAAYNSPEAAASKAKTAIKTAWQTYLNETTAGKWNPQLQQIIDRYFVSDNMKAVN